MIRFRKFKLAAASLAFVAAFAAVIPTSVQAYTDEWGHTYEWKVSEDGKKGWYEDGAKQGIYGDAKNVWYEGTERGREIYDRESDAWYWLDAVYDGAKAVSKEVFMPYVYQDEIGSDLDEAAREALAALSIKEGTDMSEQVNKAIERGEGKWVRYDANGAMIKGWYTVEGDDEAIYPTQVGNTYYYDQQTGLMAKGTTVIEGTTYHFDEKTGVLDKEESATQGDMNITKIDDGYVIESDVTLSGTGTGYHAKLVLGNETSAVSFGIQYDTASSKDFARSKQALIVENVTSNAGGGQEYFWPENITIKEGETAHLMLYVKEDGNFFVYYNGNEIGSGYNAGLANSALWGRAEGSGRLEGDTVNAVFTNVKAQYGIFKYTEDQLGTPEQVTTSQSCKTINVDCSNGFKKITISGTVTGIGGADWDTAYDSVSGYALLNFFI